MTFLSLTAMKKVPVLSSIVTDLNLKMPQMAIETLSKALKYDPIYKKETNLYEYVLDCIKSGYDSVTCKKGNILSDEGGRWGKILSYSEGIWKVRSRVSQKHGMELTMVNLPNTSEGFSYHRFQPVDYLLFRSRCKLGPVVVDFEKGFVIFSVYVPNSSISIVQCCWFYKNGKVISQITESEPSFSMARFDYEFDVKEIRTPANPDIWTGVLRLPLKSEICKYIEEDYLAMHIDEFGLCNFGRCPKSGKWKTGLYRGIPELTQDLPDKIGIPLGKKIIIAHLSMMHEDPERMTGPVVSFKDYC